MPLLAPLPPGVGAVVGPAVCPLAGPTALAPPPDGTAEAAEPPLRFPAGVPDFPWWSPPLGPLFFFLPRGAMAALLLLSQPSPACACAFPSPPVPPLTACAVPSWCEGVVWVPRGCTPVGHERGHGPAATGPDRMRGMLSNPRPAGPCAVAQALTSPVHVTMRKLGGERRRRRFSGAGAFPTVVATTPQTSLRGEHREPSDAPPREPQSGLVGGNLTPSAWRSCMNA